MFRVLHALVRNEIGQNCVEILFSYRTDFIFSFGLTSRPPGRLRLWKIYLEVFLEPCMARCASLNVHKGTDHPTLPFLQSREDRLRLVSLFQPPGSGFLSQ